jgi:hypothetical protein
MENRSRGGGNHDRKHHLRAFTHRESSLPTPAPANSDLPESTGTAERHAANLPGSATSPAGAPEHPITRDLPAKTNAALQCSIQGACLDSNPAPITPDPQPTVSTLRIADPQHGRSQF